MGWRRWRLVAAAVGFVVLAGAVALVDATPARQVTLTTKVSGAGAIRARPGAWVCRHRCLETVTAGRTITLTARPAAGNHLVRWTGACSGHGHCRVRLRRPGVVGARFDRNAGLASWNPHYRCKPILTTVPFILGSRENGLEGATEQGGGFQPHLTGSEDQHLLNPPCAVGGRGTFVEIHDVVVAANPDHSADGDEVVNMVDPNRPDIADVYMKTIHTEIDNQLITHGVAPRIQPAKGTHIDIQGFVFWDPAHTTAQWHSFSGWEIHTLTAWRPAR
jgi:hypothetical protein